MKIINKNYFQLITSLALISIGILPFAIFSLPLFYDKYNLSNAQKTNLELATTFIKNISEGTTSDIFIEKAKQTITGYSKVSNNKYNKQIKYLSKFIKDTWFVLAETNDSENNQLKDNIINLNKALGDWEFLVQEYGLESASVMFDNGYYGNDYYYGRHILEGEEIKKAAEGEIFSKIRRNVENGKECIVYTAVPQSFEGKIQYIVLVSQKVNLTYELNSVSFWDSAIISIPIFLVAIGILLFLYFKIWKPTKQLSKEIENSVDEHGKILSTSFLNDSKKNEFGELSQSFSNVIQKLNERQKELETYASDVSHEFKNPLASIRISSDILSQREMNDEERNAQIKQIQEEIHHLETLLNEIRDVSKLENNNDTKNYELIPIDEMIKNIINRMKIVKPEIEFLCKTTTPNIKIYANPTYIDRIIENLLDNATSFSDLVCTSTESSNNILRIKVEDSGIGVPDEEKEKIFNRFYSNRKNSDKKTHSGLGLHTVKTIVEKLGGTIHVERSPIFGGAMFVIDLPIRQTNIYQDTSPQNENSSESKKTLNDELIAAFIMGIHSSYGLQVNSHLDYIEYMKKNIGKKFHSYEHYKKAFTKFESGGIIINWNFSAFLTFWNLIYRKITDNLLIYLIVFVCNKAQSTLLSVLCMFSFGLFADYLYYKRFKKTRSEAQALFPKNEKRQVTYLAEHGGVLKQLPIIAIIISIIFILVNGTWFGIKIYPLVLQKVMQAFSRIFN